MAFDFGAIPALIASDQAGSRLDPTGFDPGEGAEFTASDFLAWARTMPADRSYNYSDTHGCAICQYLIDRGIGFQGVGGDTYRPFDYPKRDRQPIPKEVAEAAPAAFGATFGQLVRRLENAGVTDGRTSHL